MVGGSDFEQKKKAKEAAEKQQAERDRRFTVYSQLARLPLLTYEELVIPLRLAFASTFMAEPACIALDVIVDLCESVWVIRAYIQGRLQSASTAPAGEIAEHTESGSARLVRAYSSKHVALSLSTVAALHVGRAISLAMGGSIIPWSVVQVARLYRVHELVAYVSAINNDLTFNVRLLAPFRFVLVLLSIPHWVACLWWALASTWEDAQLALPTWVAQLELLSTNPQLRPDRYTDGHNYLMSSYMAWAGMTALGYGNMVITEPGEVCVALFVAIIQIVFYAFVLGTLFHYLVRTDESTVQFKMLLKAVDQYVAQRALPPKLSKDIRRHFEFQQRKSAAGIDGIVGQMPVSLRTEVAVEQYAKELEATWVFFTAPAQFIQHVVLHLKERYSMPNEVLIKRGDGAYELLWCVGGTLYATKGDVLIATVRSDIGPGQMLGELSYFIGIPQPYTYTVGSGSEATLLVLTSKAYEQVLVSYPEQAEPLKHNVLFKFGLDKNGKDVAAGQLAEAAPRDEDELKELEDLKETIRRAVIEQNEDRFLHMSRAVEAADAEAIRSIVQRGFDPSSTDFDGRTVLHFAAARGNVSVINLLVELGADCEAADRWGATPISYAVSRGFQGAAAALQRHGAVLELDDAALQLRDAVEAGSMSNLSMLIENGIDIQTRDLDGKTTLHVAAEVGDSRMTEYLVAKMCDVHAKDKRGRSPLDVAIVANHSVVAQILARSAARADERRAGARLRAAAATADLAQMTFILGVEASVIDACDYDMRTALHNAVRAGSLAATSFLVNAGADCNLQDRWGRTALVDALGISTDIAAVLVLSGGAELPAHFASDAELAGKMREVKAADVYRINRDLRRRTSERERARKALQESTRDAEVLSTSLADDMKHLARSQKKLFKELHAAHEAWMTTYANEDSGDDSSDGSSSDGGGDSDDAGDGHLDAAAKLVTKLLLQLGKVEAGLRALRSEVEKGLPKRQLASLDAHSRRLEEHRLFRQLLQELGLDERDAITVVGEVYEELALILGADPNSARSPGARWSNAPGLRRGSASHAWRFDSAGSVDMEAPEFLMPASSKRRAQNAARKAGRTSMLDNGAMLASLSKRVQQEMSTKHIQDMRMLSQDCASPRGSHGSDKPPDDTTWAPVYISELGYIVLFTSPTFVRVLANKHKHQRPVGVVATGAPEDSVDASSRRAGRAAAESDGASVLFSPLRAARLTRHASTRVGAPGAADSAHAPAGNPATISGAIAAVSDLFSALDAKRAGVVKVADLRALKKRLGGRGVDALLQHVLDAAAALHPTSQAADDPRAEEEGSFHRHTATAQEEGSFHRSVAPVHPDQLAAASAPAESDEQAQGCSANTSTGEVPFFAVDDGFATGPATLALDQRRGSALEQRRGSALNDVMHSLNRRTVGRVPFAVGMISWILTMGANDMPDGDEESAAAHVAPDVTVPVPPRVPRLSDVTDTGAARASDAGVAHGGGAEKASAPAAEGADLVALDVLESPEAHAAIVDAILHRIDAGRLFRDNAVAADELLQVCGQVIRLPTQTRPEHLEVWCRDQLGLDISARMEGASLTVDDDEDNPIPTWRSLVKALRKKSAAMDSTRPKGATAATSAGHLHSSTGLLGWCGQRASHAANGGAGERPWHVVSINSRTYAHAYRLFLSVAAWDGLTIPVQLGFQDETHYMEWLFYLNFGIDAVYVLYIILRFNLTFVNEKSVEVFDPKSIRMHYLNGDFALDILAAWPHDIIAWGLGADAVTHMALRATRFINLRYVYKAVQKWHHGLEDSDMAAGIGYYLGVLLVVAHLCACVWNVFGYAEVTYQYTNVTWADEYAYLRNQVGGHELEYSGSHELLLLDHYLVSMYFCLSTMTTLGLGQVPANYGEIALLIFLLVLNMTVYAWTVGQISGLVMKQDDEIVAKRAQLELVHAYVDYIRVPSDLKKRMISFFTTRLQTSTMSTMRAEDIYAGLPLALKMEVSTQTNRRLVEAAHLMQGCSQGFISRLSSLLQERTIESETVIFRAGDACKELLLIAGGEIDVFEDQPNTSIDDQTPSETLGAGDMVGVVPFVFGIRHTEIARTAVAGDVSVFVLSVESYRDLVKVFPGQEDVLMDNTMKRYDGEMTSRTGNGKSTSRSSASASSFGGSELASTIHTSNQSQAGQKSVETVVSAAKMHRLQLHHFKLCSECAKGDVARVRKYLATNAVDVNHGDLLGRRALHLAAASGNVQMVRALVSARAELDVEDARGNTPLVEALMGGHSRAAEAIARLGGTRGTRKQKQAHDLCTAAGRADAETLRRLCLHGADVNARVADRRTPLHFAAAAGKLENVQLLVSLGADVNAHSERGGEAWSTPLQDALLSRQTAVCEELVRHGAVLGTADWAFKLCSATHANDAEEVSRLVKNGCDVNTADAFGRTALHVAASMRHINAVNFLLGVKGIDLNAEDVFGHTPLDDARREEPEDNRVITTLLASFGAKLGSGVLRPSTEHTKQYEEERVARLLKLAGERKAVITRLTPIVEWVAGEQQAVAELKGAVDDALQLERLHGAVLGEERPHLWKMLQEYAQRHFLWHAEASASVQPVLASCIGDLKSFALGSSRALADKFADLYEVHQIGEMPLERLHSASFASATLEVKTSTNGAGPGASHDGHNSSSTNRSSNNSSGFPQSPAMQARRKAQQSMKKTM